MDGRAWRGNREAARTSVDVAKLPTEAEPRPCPHLDATTELQRTRIRILLIRVGASVTPQFGLRVPRVPSADGPERGDGPAERHGQSDARGQIQRRVLLWQRVAGRR